QILFSLMMAIALVVLVPRAEASAGRLEEVLNTIPSIEAPRHPARPRTLTGEVELSDVTFGYPGGEKPVLHAIDFKIRPGERTAIIGGTGSGKTTLLNLIPRFFDVSEGRLLVDGVDVRERSLEDLWSRVGLGPQRAYLSSGTVASNLRFGREDATDEELWHALEVAQATDFVEEMPGGLNAHIAHVCA